MNKIFSLIFILVGIGCTQGTEQSLIIATAANMQFAIRDLSEEYTKKNKVPCDLVISSSGKLTAQIIEGAPFDVFVSADTSYPSRLFREGFTLDSMNIYGYGKIVIWTLKETIDPVLDSLNISKIDHLSVPNPKTAPYGIAEMEYLQYENVYSRIENKLVFGESVAQTNHFVTSGAVDMGITAKSVVLSSELQNSGKWSEPPSNTYQPIAQGMVILKSTSSPERAKDFRNFIFSTEGQAILKKYGYNTIN